MNTRLAVLLIGSAVGVAAIASAPQENGSITGVVCDSSRAVIPMASVLVRNQELHTSQIFQAGPAGEFVADYIAPGKYTVEVGAPCFHTTSQPNVQVSPGSIARLKIRLEFCGLKHLTKETPNFSVRVDRHAKTDVEGELINTAERLPCPYKEEQASPSGGQAAVCAGLDAMKKYFGLVAQYKSGLAEGGQESIFAVAYYGATADFNQTDKQWLVKLVLEYTVAQGSSCGQGVYRGRWVYFNENKEVIRVDDYPPCDCGRLS